MAPRWPQVNNGPEHINEHATYLREVCNQLQAVDKGRTNQVPWNIVQSYVASTLALVGKVLQQPSMSEVLEQIQDAARNIQNIQRDVSIVKGTVGVSTAPLHATNFGGHKAVTTSWARVAAQAKGLPPPPPSAQHGTHATKSVTTVTAYQDRAVTVKLKDHGIAQRYRTKSAAWTKQQIQTAVHDNAATRLVKVVAAHQLKSGDIQIFTSTTREATQLKEHNGWIKGLGERAELIVPTYGVIVHGVSTSSINIKDQDATIEQILADNYTVVPNAKISYVGWLTKEATLKRASSIVVEFTDPAMANAIIYAGMVWDGHMHQCQLYDRACRVKQCFRCYNYGHIGTQCNASQTCGYCAEQHETRHCKQKGLEGFHPRCAVCKGAHTAWSNACPARKKEMERVEQAKQIRNTYWHIPANGNSESWNTCTPPNTINTREDRMPAPMPPARTTTHRPEEDRWFTASEDNTNAQSENLMSLPINRMDDGPIEQAPAQTNRSIEPQVPDVDVIQHMPAALSTGENWATPAMQQDELQDFVIDPQVLALGNPPLTGAPDNDQPQPTSCLPHELEQAFAVEEADVWLNNLAANDDFNWNTTAVEDDVSPQTSKATDARRAAGTLYRGCKCPSHQEIYDKWPVQDADLTIAKCMKVCMYCGRDFRMAADLRLHLKRVKYAQRNLGVYQEVRGKRTSTPAWTPRLHVATPVHRRGSEPPTRPSTPRMTRSQSLTNRANHTLQQW